MNGYNLLSVMFSPSQVTTIVIISVISAILIAFNVVLAYILYKRRERKLCTHQLQHRREELLKQLDCLRNGGEVEVAIPEWKYPVAVEEDEDVEEDEMLLVDEEEDDDEDNQEQSPEDRHNVGVVTKEEVDETLDAEILYIERTPAEVREKLGFADEQYDKKRYYVRYNMGFEARLRSANDEVKERYAALMNEIALYKGVKVKGSYRQQRIFKGRKTLALLVFRGKTLCIALALNPVDYEETKFRGIDKTGSRRFANTPMLMKITSQRRLDYVKYLLLQLAENNTILLEENPETLTFDLSEKTRDELYLENKLQIIVLGEVPDSVEYEQDEETDQEDIDVDDEDEIMILEERTIYNRSYTARILQADDELKARYSEIKNHIVAYNGVFNRITWQREAFYINNRHCIATFAIRGKTLCLFLSAPASRFDNTKYKVEDRTQQVQKAKMPTMFRIKSDRGTKYAKELIDLVFADNGVKVNADYKPVNYRPPYRATESLIRNGYIRVKTAQVPIDEATASTKASAAKKAPAVKSKAPKKTK